MREEILKMRRFEDLNNEKISHYFLSLVKRPQNSESLVDLNRDNGTPFDSKADRDRYIKDYFVDTYKYLPDTVTDQSIKAFLCDIAQHLDVIASKFSDTERDDLKKELSVNEFDVAINKAKINTVSAVKTET